MELDKDDFTVAFEIEWDKVADRSERDIASHMAWWAKDWWLKKCVLIAKACPDTVLKVPTSELIAEAIEAEIDHNC